MGEPHGVIGLTSSTCCLVHSRAFHSGFSASLHTVALCTDLQCDMVEKIHIVKTKPGQLSG